jgi:hypothetical protein
MDEGPALKLWNNKKEQEKYENLAGEQGRLVAQRALAHLSAC